jgi:hypothetical protein
MEMAEVFIFDAGWLFFTAWGIVLAAVGIIAFGQDILEIGPRGSSENNQMRIDR